MISFTGSRRVLCAIMLSASSTAALAQGALPTTPGQPQTDSASHTPPAQGQADAASPEQTSSSAEGGDIIVTAQRREQRLQDVPVAVSVTTGAQISNLGIRDLQDLATRLPAVKISSQVVSSTINIRGVGSGQNVGFEQSVGTFVDGVYRGRSRSSQAGLFDVERVEVLKGPQSIFFGNNTIAGALNITTRKPGDHFGYNARTSYAPSDDEYLLEAGVDLPVTPTLAVRLAGRASGMNGYIANQFTGSTDPHLRDLIGRVALRWTPTTNFESNFRFDRLHNRDTGTFSPDIRNCPPTAAYGVARGACAAYLALKGGVIDNQVDFRSDVGPSGFRLDLSEGVWTNRLDLGPVSLNSITSYYDQHSATYNQSQPLAVPGVGTAPSRAPFQELEHDTAFSQELRLESNSAGPVQYVAGLYYAKAHVVADDYTGVFAVPSVGAAGAPVTSAATPVVLYRNFNQHETDRSAFGQLTVTIAPPLKLAVGVRYTNVNKRAFRDEFAGTTTAPIPGPDFTQFDPATQLKVMAAGGVSKANYAQPNRDYNKFMPSANLQLKLTPTINTYASYSKGFKAGGYAVTGNPFQFDSESANAFEIGSKGSLLNRRLFFALDGFYTKYNNLQEAIATFNSSGQVVASVGNAAQSTSKGIELSLSYQHSSYVSVGFEGSYLVSRYNSYPNGQCTALQLLLAPGGRCVQDLSGRTRPFAPRFSGAFNASLGAPVGDDLAVRFEPSLYVTAGYYTDPTIDQLAYQPHYAVADLRISFGRQDRHWELALIGKNLNQSKVSDATRPFGGSPGTQIVVLNRARSVAISLSIRN